MGVDDWRPWIDRRARESPQRTLNKARSRQPRGAGPPRSEPLALFDLSLAEIAVSILAEVVAVKNGVALTKKKDGSAMPLASGVCAR